MSEDQHRGLQTAEFGRVMRGWGDGGDQETRLVVQAICTSIVAKAQRHDDSWFVFTSNELGIPEAVLRDYAAHGDSLSLAILIYVTRQQFSHFWEWIGLMIVFSQVLQTASKFNVQDTPPELQHRFCTLWNEIVVKVQNDNDRSMAFQILGPIHDVYIALHPDTDAASTQFSASTTEEDWLPFDPTSYPLCNIPGHHPDSKPHIHDDSASTIVARTILHDNAVLVSASLASLDAPSSSVHAPLHVINSLMDVPESFHPVHQTAIENPRIAAASQDPVTARVIKGGIDTSARTIPLSTPEPSASTAPLTSIALASPPGTVAVQHIADRRISSDVLDVPSLPSPTPVLHNMLPTGP